MLETSDRMHEAQESPSIPSCLPMPDQSHEADDELCSRNEEIEYDITFLNGM